MKARLADDEKMSHLNFLGSKFRKISKKNRHRVQARINPASQKKLIKNGTRQSEASKSNLSTSKM